MKKISYVKQKLLITLGILAYAVVLYVLPVSCVFKEIFGFKCPGCGRWLRVPRHKGKIHINCRCGYTLYRRT